MFNEAYSGFEWFGLQHLLALLWIIVSIVLISYFKDKVSAKTDLYIRRITAILMITMEWTFYTWSLSRGWLSNFTVTFRGVCYQYVCDIIYVMDK